MNIFSRALARVTLKALALVQTYSVTNPALGKILAWGQPSMSGKTVNEETAMRIATVWSCVRLLAETIGYLPWHIYEADPASGNAQRVDHPLGEVLITSPNADMTSVEMKEAKITNLAISGNAYSFKETYSNGEVLSLTPIPSIYVTPFIQSDGTLIYKVYDRGKIVPYPQEKIWHVKGFGSNGISGLSPIGYARESMGMALATEEFQSRFFANGASPSWIVSVPLWLEDNQREKARKNIEDLWGGLENAHAPRLLEGGMTATPGTMPLADAQFIELRQLTVEEICRIFRVPPHLVFDLRRSTNNNIEQQSLEFLMYSLQPYLSRIESSASKWLFTAKDRKRFFLKFNVEGLMRADATGRANLYSSALQNGWMTRNQVRARENLNREKDPSMDSYTVQTNLTPIDKLAALADKAATPTPIPIVPPAAPPAKGIELTIHNPEHKTLVVPILQERENHIHLAGPEVNVAQPAAAAAPNVQVEPAQIHVASSDLSGLGDALVHLGDLVDGARKAQQADTEVRQAILKKVDELRSVPK